MYKNTGDKKRRSDSHSRQMWRVEYKIAGNELFNKNNTLTQQD